MIAEKYNVKTEDLKLWNHLNSRSINPEQRLFVYDTLVKVVPVNAEKSQVVEKAIPKKKQEQNVYYKVKKGDSLSKIVSKNKGTSIEKILEYNNMKRNDNLIPGDKIIIKKKKK